MCIFGEGESNLRAWGSVVVMQRCHPQRLSREPDWEGGQNKSQLCAGVRGDVEPEGHYWAGLIPSPPRTRVPTDVP